MLWYYTDRQEPNLVALKATSFLKPLRPDLSATGVIPPDKFQAAYLKAGGWEGLYLRIPHPMGHVGRHDPAESGRSAGVDGLFFWGTPDGFKTAGDSAWCYDVMAGPGFPYQWSACWGKVIFSAQGHTCARW